MPESRSNLKFGLTLTGGGARSAYQAGAIRALSEILPATRTPFPIMTGISAGAINTAFLASRCDDFAGGARALCELWANLETDHVVKTNFGSLGRLGGQWLRDLAMGGVTGRTSASYLLDTSPLRELLFRNIRFSRIRNLIQKGTLHGISISATNYQTGTAISFFDGDASIQPWRRSFRLGVRDRISLRHVLASASIPILFEPVRLEKSFYGDGSIRLNAPLSPTIHLGADRLLAIAVRYPRPIDLTAKLNQMSQMDEISLADIAGVMMNASFLDSVEGDQERMLRINQTVSLLSEEQRRNYPLKQIPLLVLKPSQDLGALAADQFKKFPRVLRYLMKGIGASQERGSDFLSYLAFDKTYTRALIELGRTDTLKMKDEITEFFRQP